jgi:hypothetical protein
MDSVRIVLLFEMARFLPEIIVQLACTSKFMLQKLSRDECFLQTLVEDVFNFTSARDKSWSELINVIRYRFNTVYLLKGPNILYKITLDNFYIDNALVDDVDWPKGHAWCFLTSELLHVSGGYQGGEKKDTFVLNVASLTQKPGPFMLETRWGHASYYYDKVVYVFGGNGTKVSSEKLVGD